MNKNNLTSKELRGLDILQKAMIYAKWSGVVHKMSKKNVKSWNAIATIVDSMLKKSRLDS